MKTYHIYRCLLVALLGMALIAGGCFKRSEARRGKAQEHYNMGIAALNENNLVAALAELMEAAKQDPGDPTIQNALGVAFIHKKRYDDAEKHFLKALDLNPKLSEAANNLGTVYMETNRLDLAIKYYNLALEDILYPTPERALFNLGRVYAQKGILFKAVEYYQQALNANVNFVIVHYYLGEAYAKMGREKDACKEFLFVRDRFPDSELKVMAGKYSDLFKCK